MKKKDEQSDGKMKLLNIDYFKYKTQLTKKYEARKVYEARNENLVTAFIPGTIRKISVNEGDSVKKGELLLTLEAMKMKNRILSPVDGKVVKITVKPGDIVAKNAPLIELG